MPTPSPNTVYFFSELRERVKEYSKYENMSQRIEFYLFQTFYKTQERGCTRSVAKTIMSVFINTSLKITPIKYMTIVVYV